MRTLMAILALAAIVAPATAQACDVAEKLRLAEEQKKLAARNAWSGVERAFENLQATKCELDFDHYFLGAESARYLGKTWEQYERLSKAKDLDPQPQILESLEAIEGAYGRVELIGDPRRRPVLTRAEMPFAPDQRKSIEWAQTVVAETGSFYGMLPAGDYVVGELDFAVTAGQEFEQITVGKVKKTDVATGPAPSGGGTSTASFLRYANLVATIGPSFTLTPEGARIPELQDGGDQFSPASITAPGLSLQVGGELGLTYEEPALGLAGVLGYNGGYGGTDTLHALSGWVAGVARPGDLRLALGPMYQVTFGTGSGVHPDFDRDHDQSVDPNSELPYGGLAWGPGLQGSVGYGLLDFDALQGVVELGGAWQSDGARSYFGFGLRVGIVPTVPRFEG